MRIGVDLQATLGTRTGIGVYAAGLWQALRAHCREHEFIPLRWGQSHRWPLPAELLREQWLAPSAAAIQHLDVVHATGFPCPVWGRAARIMTVHDISVLDRPDLLPSPASRWYWSDWLGWVAGRADMVITPSKFTADRLVERLRIPARKIVTLPYPPRDLFRPATESEQRALRAWLNIEGPYCLGVGALEPRKDWIGLVRAFSRVARRCPHSLILAGPVNVPGSQRELDTVLRRLDLRDRVRWLGYVPEPQLPALYSAADLFIFPETYAGYGLPVLEAMACGAPVLTYMNTALKETAGDAALLLPPPYEPEVLAEMMLYLLRESELRRDLSRRGLARVRQLDWEQTTECLSLIYSGSATPRKMPEKVRPAEPSRHAAGAGS